MCSYDVIREGSLASTCLAAHAKQQCSLARTVSVWNLLAQSLSGPCRKALLEAAGFKFSRLIETRGVFSLVEALPAPIPNLKAGSEGEDSQDVHINLKHKYLKDYGVINVDLEPEP